MLKKPLPKLIEEIRGMLTGTKIIKVAIGKDKKPIDKPDELIFHIDI
ncbi:hypothetical protein UFOVP23_30 [uncultured Caudovirales phage]|uniref:Uncharacterized protein n=1 Tax=uncultured Caudovirales phage TaxID=2100421 RepID=A0A6J5T877_9CAUD|nr:hypothetical protein UFOVP23_30 [uncultured Caudovirales phage]